MLSLPPRALDTHKGSYGRALIVGGSQGMSGAAALAALSALRSGAGLVEAATPRSCQDVVAGFDPSYLTFGLPDDDAGRIAGAAAAAVAERCRLATAVGVGPGLGRSAELDELVARWYETLDRPALFDADALNALANPLPSLRRPLSPRVFTPHPGEFLRLIRAASMVSQDSGTGPASPAPRSWRDYGDAERVELATRFAQRFGLVLVLKGHRTIITDGAVVVRNTTGNPGMASGGTGDVLTGIITALLAQGRPPLDAAHLGAHVHGLAGDLAAAELGQVSLLASDLLRYLPAAWRSLAD